MAKELQEWDCNGDVSYEYFKVEGLCTPEYIDGIIKKILSDYPEHYIYFGITHNPCGRWTSNYNKELPTAFKKNEAVAEPIAVLTEEAHKEYYEQMFVICHSNSEAKIRATEEVAITFAKIANSNRIINDKKGGNGNLAENAPFYFLYSCISRTRLMQS